MKTCTKCMKSRPNKKKHHFLINLAPIRNCTTLLINLAPIRKCTTFLINLAPIKSQAPIKKLHQFLTNQAPIFYFQTTLLYMNKHRKNCECCPVSLLIVRKQRLSRIQVLNCQNSNQCLNCQKSLW